MATRFYFPNLTTGEGGVPKVGVSTQGPWEQTTGNLTKRAFHGRTMHSGYSSQSVTKTAAVANQNVLFRRYISDPIEAITIAGTIKGQFRAFETAIANDAMPQLFVYVWRPDTEGNRGTLLAFVTSALSNELNTALRNVGFPRRVAGSTLALTSVAALTGDRIVFEVGTRVGAATASIATSINFGAVLTDTDLPENETQTTAGVPWIEISDTLKFLPEDPTYNYTHKQNYNTKGQVAIRKARQIV